MVIQQEEAAKVGDIPETVSSIKQAAEFTGLSEDTIRFYEKIGLLPYADRKANGHRTYSKHQLEGMVFLTRLKATGITLKEMKQYRSLSDQGTVSIPQNLHSNRTQEKNAERN
ncbi:MerR family DNA-binding transcriptional regulator [Alicyclobacillus dauci]|uniref:MerR family DNA-binding transcriptional regulator n=1 Tax=Alicyclobacillus dauci TaxID=1475485 RepID=A0ABY6Z9A4_9BACL|nr:MerR family DNA-binding transcriptional regulator [Alicyclobacillus dauci]WAH39439.1 MerR family DNA-binding transcriptional regulator [Alicyclobacillus dauci]